MRVKCMPYQILWDFYSSTLDVGDFHFCQNNNTLTSFISLKCDFHNPTQRASDLSPNLLLFYSSEVPEYLFCDW